VNQVSEELERCPFWVARTGLERQSWSCHQLNPPNTALLQPSAALGMAAGKYDAFETTLEILRVKLAHPDAKPQDYVKARVAKQHIQLLMWYTPLCMLASWPISRGCCITAVKLQVDDDFRRFMACGAEELGYGMFLQHVPWLHQQSLQIDMSSNLPNTTSMQVYVVSVSCRDSKGGNKANTL
jgi:hypothetical protein